MSEVRMRIEGHIPALRRYALSLARNPVAADDLVQDCLVRALDKAELFKAGTNLRAWLFTILRNLHISESRRSGKWKAASDPDTALSMLSSPASQAAAVMLVSVGKAMKELPEQQRLVLYSVGVEGKTYDEVSDELDIPVGTVKSRCFRARESLQGKLGMAEVEGSGMALSA